MSSTLCVGLQAWQALLVACPIGKPCNRVRLKGVLLTSLAFVSGCEVSSHSVQYALCRVASLASLALVSDPGAMPGASCAGVMPY